MALYSTYKEHLTQEHEKIVENECIGLRGKLYDLFVRIRVNIFVPEFIDEQVQEDVLDPNFVKDDFDPNFDINNDNQDNHDIMVQSAADVMALAGRTINKKLAFRPEVDLFKSFELT